MTVTTTATPDNRRRRSQHRLLTTMHLGRSPNHHRRIGVIRLLQGVFSSGWNEGRRFDDLRSSCSPAFCRPQCQSGVSREEIGDSSPHHGSWLGGLDTLWYHHDLGSPRMEMHDRGAGHTKCHVSLQHV